MGMKFWTGFGFDEMCEKFLTLTIVLSREKRVFRVDSTTFSIISELQLFVFPC